MEIISYEQEDGEREDKPRSFAQQSFGVSLCGCSHRIGRTMTRLGYKRKKVGGSYETLNMAR